MVSGTPLLYTIGDTNIYLGGVIYGLTTALRVLAMMLGTMMFVITTDLADFIRSLIQNLKLPYRVGFGMLATFRFIPMLSGEIENIRSAHKVRGISESGGPISQYHRLRRYAVPLLATGIRKAERVALAMDSRAFGCDKNRSWLRKSHFSIHDVFFITLNWSISLIYLLILHYFNLMGNLIFIR